MLHDLCRVFRRTCAPPRSRRVGAVTVLFLSALGALCGDGAASSAAAPQRGGTLTVAVDLEFRGFDPLKTGYLQFGDRSVVMALEERLFDMDQQGNLVPELGLSATPSVDGTTWTISLRKGVVFHDGTPFDADAVVDHWQRMLDPDSRYPGAVYLEPVQAVSKVDQFTVRFTLKHRWGAFRAMLCESQWMGAFIPSPKAVREKTQNRRPVGTGPFAFKEWVANDHLTVIRNGNYWRKGKPFLESVTFRPIPDRDKRFASLKAGTSDVVLSDRGSEFAQAGSDKTLRVYSAEASGPYTLIINTEAPPLDDPRVRQALAHAWDQELYLKTSSGGTLSVARDPFGGSVTCSDPGYRNYDPAKAKKLLAEHGEPVTLELLERDTPGGREAGGIVQRLFKEIGITVTLAHLPEQELVQRVMSGEYQISDWRLMDLNDMGPYFNVALQTAGKLNFSRYSNPAMDELLKAQQLTTDPTARHKALCGVAGLINQDVMYLYAGNRRFYLITRGSVEGLAGAEHGVVKVSEAWISPGTTPLRAPSKAPQKAAPKASQKATQKGKVRRP